MGNSLAYAKPWSDVVIGKLEKGCEAIDYLETKKPEQAFSIEEHTPSGVEVIHHSTLKGALASNLSPCKDNRFWPESEASPSLLRQKWINGRGAEGGLHATQGLADGWKLRHDEYKVTPLDFSRLYLMTR